MSEIKIKTTKIVERGVAMRRINAIQAASRDELPLEYLSKDVFCYSDNGVLRIVLFNITDLSVVS